VGANDLIIAGRKLRTLRNRDPLALRRRIPVAVPQFDILE